MTKPTITINELDAERLDALLAQPAFAGTVVAQALNEELDRAEILPPNAIPADVVTMNSEVKISFLNNNNTVKFKIVYPEEANIRENKISIFSPIATALLGYRTGMEVEWMVPAGLTKIHIDEILYQPEAAGNYNL